MRRILGIALMWCLLVLPANAQQADNLIQSVDVSTHGPLFGGQSLRMTLRASPGGQAAFQLGGQSGWFHQVAPGIYKATFRAQQGEEDPSAQLSVTMFMADGRTDTRQLGTVELRADEVPLVYNDASAGNVAGYDSAYYAGVPETAAAPDYGSAGIGSYPMPIPSIYDYGYATPYSDYDEGIAPYQDDDYLPYAPGTAFIGWGPYMSPYYVEAPPPIYPCDPLGLGYLTAPPATQFMLSLQSDGAFEVGGIFSDGLAFNVGDEGFAMDWLPCSPFIAPYSFVDDPAICYPPPVVGWATPDPTYAYAAGFPAAAAAAGGWLDRRHGRGMNAESGWDREMRMAAWSGGGTSTAMTRHGGWTGNGGFTPGATALAGSSTPAFSGRQRGASRVAASGYSSGLRTPGRFGTATMAARMSGGAKYRNQTQVPAGTRPAGQSPAAARNQARMGRTVNHAAATRVNAGRQPNHYAFGPRAQTAHAQATGHTQHAQATRPRTTRRTVTERQAPPSAPHTHAVTRTPARYATNRLTAPGRVSAPRRVAAPRRAVAPRAPAHFAAPRAPARFAAPRAPARFAAPRAPARFAAPRAPARFAAPAPRAAPRVAAPAARPAAPARPRR